MLRRLAPCGSGHRDHTSVATPERRAALISWGLPRQQGSLLTKVNERTGEWACCCAGSLDRRKLGGARSGPVLAAAPPRRETPNPVSHDLMGTSARNMRPWHE